MTKDDYNYVATSKEDSHQTSYVELDKLANCLLCREYQALESTEVWK